MQAQYFQQQTRQLQLQQQGYLAQQQRQPSEQAMYGGGYQRSMTNAADNALARRLQEEEMAGAPVAASPAHACLHVDYSWIACLAGLLSSLRSCCAAPILSLQPSSVSLNHLTPAHAEAQKQVVVALTSTEGNGSSYNVSRCGCRRRAAEATGGEPGHEAVQVVLE